MSQLSLAESQAIEELRERIAACRRGRYARAPLPRELWREATQCARRLGVYRAAQALGVSFDSLRGHLAEPDRGQSERGSGVGFVELGGATVLGVRHGTALELENRGGSRLSIRLAAGDSLDVAAVVSAFAGGQACCK